MSGLFGRLAPCVLICACLGLVAEATGAQAQSRAEERLVREVFADVQPESIRRNREYCGYLVELENGSLTTTQAHRGRKDSCLAPWPKEGTPVASWHTHAAYDPRAWNELPSPDDVISDNDEEVNGWVATPGGRLWYIDGASMEVQMICGIGCLPRDSGFVQGSDGTIRDQYSFPELLEKFE